MKDITIEWIAEQKKETEKQAVIRYIQKEIRWLENLMQLNNLQDIKGIIQANIYQLREEIKKAQLPINNPSSEEQLEGGEDADG